MVWLTHAAREGLLTTFYNCELHMAAWTVLAHYGQVFSRYGNPAPGEYAEIFRIIFRFTPAEYDPYATCDPSDNSPKHNLSGSTLKYGIEGPDCAERVALQAAVNSQAHAASSHGVDSHIEELHPHSVENLKGKKSSC